MLDITTIDDSYIGTEVVYRESYYSKGNMFFQGKIERGTITSYNEKFIFVCFDGTGRGCACNPEDLTSALMYDVLIAE